MHIKLVIFSGLLVALSVVSGSALGNPTLRLKVVGPAGPFPPGETVTVAVSMSDLGANQAAGFQAFLRFDTQALLFREGHYTAAPFGVPIIFPIAADGENIDLASGINVFIGQGPTSADSTLAFLQFDVLQHTCLLSDVEFRPHDPPSRITDAQGNEIIPLDLVPLPAATCPADIVPTGVVQVQDLLLLIQNWGICPPGLDCCADINNDNVVNVQDLLLLINAWGACP